MDLRMDLTEAERKAREYVKKKYGKKVKIFFKSTCKEHDGWLIEGEIKIIKALIFTDKRTFRLRLHSKTGEVIYYKEIRI